ncbi:MAG: RDD family protein [Nitrospirae bacterium]|nr:RDD family protein [Nitrospirota bacterium]
MPKWESKEEYEKWKQERLKQTKEAPQQSPPQHAGPAQYESPPQQSTGTYSTKPEVGDSTLRESYSYAGAWIRFVALIIDNIIIGIGILIIAIPLAALGAVGGMGHGERAAAKLGVIFGLIGFLIGWVLSVLYFILIWSKTGSSLGMKICGIRLVNKDGGNPTGTEAFLRWLTGYFLPGIIPYLSIVAFIALGIMIGTNERKQGWHDKAAKTFAIRV